MCGFSSFQHCEKSPRFKFLGCRKWSWVHYVYVMMLVLKLWRANNARLNRFIIEPNRTKISEKLCCRITIWDHFGFTRLANKSSLSSFLLWCFKRKHFCFVTLNICGKLKRVTNNAPPPVGVSMSLLWAPLQSLVDRCCS